MKAESFLFRSIALASVLATTSCSLISETGPLKNKINKDGSPYEIVHVQSTADIPSHGRVYGKADIPPSIKGQAYSDKIRVRDYLEFIITDVSEQSPFRSAGAYKVGPMEVPADGKVGIPYADELEVLDLSLSDAAAALQEKLKNVSQTARVSVLRTGRLSRTANVLGEVNTPGPVTLERAGMNSLDLLAAAGGPKGSEHLFQYTLRRGTAEYRFDYLGFQKNPFIIEEGDLLTVTTDVTNRFHVMGAINRPVSIAFPLPNPTLADALGSASGLDERRSDPSGVFVFRKGNPNTVYTFNLKDPAIMALVQRFPMQGEDIIYVTEAPLVRWNRMLSLILPGSMFQVANVAPRYSN